MNMRFRMFHIAVPIALLMSAAPGSAAEPFQGEVIHVYKTTGAGHKSQEITAALVNMTPIMSGQLDNCSQSVESVKVEGIQFNQSGTVLELFRFTGKNAYQQAIPTNIQALPKLSRGEANSFIKVGKSYLIHVQYCGSGGYPDLISMYDMNVAGR